MTIPKRALIFGGMGLASLLCLIFNLLMGPVTSGRYRESGRFQFYLRIIFYALLAVLFIGTGIFFFLHPEFNPTPATHVSDE
jgi:hypothetical protein